jgi:AhpD family alkylhydroperoxidase
MSGPLTRRALRRALSQIRYVSPVPPATAVGLVATVYQQAERDFGMLAPPVALHSPAPGSLAACWLMLRETLIVPGLADRAAKEAVAAAVSLGNSCPYCVAVHVAAVRTMAGERASEQIAADRIAAIPDPRLRGIAAWARLSGLRDHALARSAPFPAEQAPELAGVAVTFHYLNRMVSVFLGDSPLPSAVPTAVRRPLLNMLGRIMASAGPAGAAADLLPVAEPPGDLSGTDRSPRITSVFAKASAAMDRVGGDTVPPQVRELVLSELAGWDGHPRGPSRSWALTAASRLAEADRPAGRLALLTAFSAYQVTASDVEDFRSGQPADEALVGLTAWASFAAARHLGTWLRLRGLFTRGESARRSRLRWGYRGGRGPEFGLEALSRRGHRRRRGFPFITRADHHGDQLRLKAPVGVVRGH